MNMTSEVKPHIREERLRSHTHLNTETGGCNTHENVHHAVLRLFNNLDMSM